MSGRFIGENIRQVYDIMSYTELNNIPGLLLLIDFEKAFDSVSHEFIFKTLDLFNFGDGFKRWISVFYKNAQSSVLVNGHMTRFFDINSGCRQGDGLSPYIFLLCSQILNIAINNCVYIKGVTIDSMEYKALQYADDTTIILDGTENSLLHTFKLLDDFHNISGLKINMDKTSAVWIGSKRGSDEVLCKHYNLFWVGDKIFSYLGVILCTHLDIIVNINYVTTMQAITKQIHHWSKRFLTVLGRIVVVKSLLLPKLNHLVLSLPTPGNEIVKEINSPFYNFVWGGKIDRISRNQMALPVTKGGASMIQFEPFEKALKITWIRRLLKHNINSKVFNLFKVNTPICNFDYSSGTYWNSVIKECKNAFWKSVFSAWKDFTVLLKPPKNEDVLSSSIWHNEMIKVGHRCILYKEWFRHGILYVNDLLTSEGEFLSADEIYKKYDVRINFLHLHGIKKAIRNSYSDFLDQTYNSLALPFQGFNVKTVLMDPKGCKRFYNILLTNNKVKYKCINKWNLLLPSFFSEVDWHKVCSYNWKCTSEVKLRWFQFRLLNRILGTNTLMVKIGKTNNPLCTFCGLADESLFHLFWECSFTQKVWRDFQNWVKTKLNINITLSKELVLFGNYVYKDYVFNNILLVLKFCVYKSKVKNEKPSFSYCKIDIKNFYLKEKFMYNINGKQRTFDNRWHKWKSLFVF